MKSTFTFLYKVLDEIISRQGSILILGIGILLSNLPANAKENLLLGIVGINGTIGAVSATRRLDQEQTGIPASPSPSPTSSPTIPGEADYLKEFTE